jgi:putative ABC transport system substrate-binding protein
MRRRDLLTNGAALLVLMGFAAGQTARQWRVAYVASGNSTPSVDWFRKALHSLGYKDNENLVLDVREARGDYSLLPEILRQVVRLRPDVIVAAATPAVAAAKEATPAIPIVMANSSDPIGSGFVQSFAHPGGNITGIANMYGELAAKTLEILHLAPPNVKKIGILVSNNPAQLPIFDAARRGAEILGISAERFVAKTPNDLKAAFAAMKLANCEAVYVLADAVRPTIPQLALQFALPAIYQADQYVDIGGLMSYGPEGAAMNFRAADYVDRIIKGGNPADMPVEQPTTFRLLVNLGTAKALGLAIPESVLVQADKVIE